MKTNRYDDLHLADDPYLLERARWRAVLADPKPSPRERRARRVRAASTVAGYLLAVGLGLAFALLAVYTAMG